MTRESLDTSAWQFCSANVFLMQPCHATWRTRGQTFFCQYAKSFLSCSILPLKYFYPKFLLWGKGKLTQLSQGSKNFSRMKSDNPHCLSSRLMCLVSSSSCSNTHTPNNWATTASITELLVGGYMITFQTAVKFYRLIFFNILEILSFYNDVNWFYIIPEPSFQVKKELLLNKYKSIIVKTPTQPLFLVFYLSPSFSGTLQWEKVNDIP